MYLTVSYEMIYGANVAYVSNITILDIITKIVIKSQNKITSLHLY